MVRSFRIVRVIGPILRKGVLYAKWVAIMTRRFTAPNPTLYNSGYGAKYFTIHSALTQLCLNSGTLGLGHVSSHDEADPVKLDKICPIILKFRGVTRVYIFFRATYTSPAQGALVSL